jgi:hypothetical protein
MKSYDASAFDLAAVSEATAVTDVEKAMAFARDTLGTTDAPFEAKDLVERAGEVPVCPLSPHLYSLFLLLLLLPFNTQNFENL